MSLFYCFGSFIVLGVILFLLAIIWIVANAAGMWKMFEKAHVEGWKALIPAYNVYTKCILFSDRNNFFGVIVSWVFLTAFSEHTNIILWLLYILSIAAVLYFTYRIASDVAECFGKERQFVWGLMFLEPIFHCILGFGSSGCTLKQSRQSSGQ